MPTNLLSRLQLPPRRFRRLVIFGLLIPTWFFSWGVRTEGCSSDRPIPLLPPARTVSFANPEMIWTVVLLLGFLALPFLTEKIRSPGWRALVNVIGALLGAFLAVLLTFVAAFMQALFGRIVSLSVAGVLGLVCIAGLALEGFSWVAADIVTAWRARAGRARTSGVQLVSAGELVGEEGGQPAAGDAVEDEG